MNPGRPSTVAVTHAGTGQVVAIAELADTPQSRRRGLLGRRGLSPGSGLLISPCSSIHTWFMKFPIDAVFLDRNGRVVKIAGHVRPFRLVFGGWAAEVTLELPAGAAADSRLSPGDVLLTGPAGGQTGKGEGPPR